MDAQLVLDTAAEHIVARAECSIGADEEFGDDKQRDAARSRRIARASCFHLGAALGESAWATRHGPAVFAGRLDDAAARAKLAAFEREWGKGWIGVTGHLGNWELLGLWLRENARNGRVTVVAKRAPNPHLNRIVERMRGRLRLETLYQDESPARAIHVLREGGVVGIVPDQDVKAISGMFVDFFGRPAYTPVGPARLAVAARVPILCGFLVHDGDGYRMSISDPIWPDRSLPRSAQIDALTRAWSQQIEAAIRELPSQWPWMHDRWKTTPEKLAAKGRKALEVG